MPKGQIMQQELSFRPVTAENWGDMEALFEKKGGPHYCWCMSWRLADKDFQSLPPEGYKAAMKNLVFSDTPVGILAYQSEKPVGWCSIAPRSTYKRLPKLPEAAAQDQRGVWTIACFFLERPLRGLHLTPALLQAAISYAGSQGAKTIEAHPIHLQAKEGENKASLSYRSMGFASTFEKAGFADLGPIGTRRRLMRLDV